MNFFLDKKKKEKIFTGDNAYGEYEHRNTGGEAAHDEANEGQDAAHEHHCSVTEANSQMGWNRACTTETGDQIKSKNVYDKLSFRVSRNVYMYLFTYRNTLLSPKSKCRHSQKCRLHKSHVCKNCNVQIDMASATMLLKVSEHLIFL